MKKWLKFLLLIILLGLVVANGADVVRRIVYTKLRMLSPEQDLSYYFCPQGPPGPKGPKGMPGAYDLPEYITSDVLKRYAKNHIGYKCLIHKTTEVILSNLSQDKVYNMNLTPGPPGLPGRRGLHASEVIGRRIVSICRSLNTTMEICPFQEELQEEILVTLKALKNRCPSDIAGIYGTPGEDGDHGLHFELDWTKVMAHVNCDEIN
jgi:hypothetical protein